jgi:hypothetical protein
MKIRLISHWTAVQGVSRQQFVEDFVAFTLGALKKEEITDQEFSRCLQLLLSFLADSEKDLVIEDFRQRKIKSKTIPVVVKGLGN